MCSHMQLYIPSALFVLAAYITLFMPPMGLVARSGVPVMVLFALFNLNNGGGRSTTFLRHSG